MTKVKMFIVEDDFIHANMLAMHLDEMGYDLTGSAKDSEEALHKIATVNPDLILMDINIEGDKDGIEVAEHLNRKNAIPIIFITSFRDQMTFNRAKQTDPYAYILKPYDKQALQMAIELAVYKLTKEFNESPGNIIEEQNPKWEEDQIVAQKLFVKSEGRLIKIETNEIFYVEVKGKHCLIGLQEKIISVRITLGKLEDKLDQSKFVRIHRSFIVNLSIIEEVNLTKNEISIQNLTIPIGRNYRESLVNKLGKI